MGKKKRTQQQLDNEGQHDILAWGKSRKQYYQQKQDQYSSVSQQKAQGEEIYNQQFNYLNEGDFYNPQQEKESQEDEQCQKQLKTQLSEEYLKSQIKITIQLVKKFQQIDDQFSEIRKRLCDTYLLILLSLKQCRIPYIDQHPILNNLSFLKKGIQHFSSMLYFQNFDDQDFQQQQCQQQENELQFGNEQEEQDQQQKLQGLEVYRKYEIKKKLQKKQKKQQKKAELRKKKQEIETFKTVEQNQGRLINEKMSKNKGLMKKRKKINGNSRVVLRKKYADKMKKMRSKGKVIRQNPGNYQGEPNIKFGRYAGVKLKK